MSKKEIFQEGQLVGDYGCIFVKEVSPLKSSSGHSYRRAEFICGFCGKKFVTKIANIKYGYTKSCGCALKHTQREKSAKKFIGKRFGKLTVIEQVIVNDSVMYKCQCDCGNTTIVKAGNLTSGNTQSCGCLEKEILDKKYFQDLTGRKFGKLTVLFYLGKKGRNRWWRCRCECGNIVDRTQTTILKDNSSCGCQHSIGETKIANILQQNNIKFEREYSFLNCINPRTNKKLRFDFYLPDYNTCIEFDGRQHFQSKGSFAELESLENIQYRDKIKTDYCISHNILLIRIPFGQIDKIDIEDILNIIKYNTERFMISYSPMITRMLDAFDKYDKEKDAISREQRDS